MAMKTSITSTMTATMAVTTVVTIAPMAVAEVIFELHTNLQVS